MALAKFASAIFGYQVRPEKYFTLFVRHIGSLYVKLYADTFSCTFAEHRIHSIVGNQRQSFFLIRDQIAAHRQHQQCSHQSIYEFSHSVLLIVGSLDR